MGFYNRVAFLCDCPGCGERVDDFQTKDPPAIGDDGCYIDLDLSIVGPETVGNFYSDCPRCKLWIEFDAVDAFPNHWRQSSSPSGYPGAARVTLPRRLRDFPGSSRGPSLIELPASPV